MNPIDSITLSKLGNRILVAVILGLIGIPCILLGGWPAVIFTMLLLPLAVHEFTNARPHNRYKLIMHIFIMVMSFSLVYGIFFRNNFNEYQFDFSLWTFEQGFSQLEASTIGIAITVSVLFLSSILNINFKVADATYLNTMIILVSMSFQSMLYLRFLPEVEFAKLAIERGAFFDAGLILYVVLGSFMSDIGAYFVGTFFGRIKLNERVSKRKTWEGFFGGIIISVITSLTFAFTLDALGYPLLPILDLDHWYFVVFLSLVIPFISVLGDLLFSMVKREFDIKNFSTLLGEHGGLLDRIDSLMLAALSTAVTLSFLLEINRFLG